MSSADDQSILAHILEEEWNRVDRNHDGVVDKVELSWLLGECSMLEPSPEVVNELMVRMAGKGAVSVTKRQFLDHLISLGNDVAKDRRAPLGSWERGKQLRFAAKAIMSGSAAS